MTKKTPEVILITGCSSGFGLLTAARLSSKGYTVIATMRNLNKQEALLSEVRSRGGTVDIVQLDVTDKESIDKAITEIGEKYGYIDALINNAGYGLGGFFEDMTEEEIRAQMETNFFGVQNVTRKVIPFMRQKHSGKIINISSGSGFSSSPGLGAYNASKWALEGFSESLYYELKIFGIDVVLVEPGTYKTKIFYENAQYAENFHNEQSPYYQISMSLKNRVKEYVDDCHKDPEDIARIIEKLINRKNPPLRVQPDIETKMMFFLRKFLPFRIYSFIVRKGILSDSTQKDTANLP